MQKKKIVSMEQAIRDTIPFKELTLLDFKPTIEILKQLSKFFPVVGALGQKDPGLYRSSMFVQKERTNATNAEVQARATLAQAQKEGDPVVTKAAEEALELATKEKKEKSPPALEEIQVVILSVLNRSLTLNQLAPAIEAQGVVSGAFLGKGSFGVVTARGDNLVCKEVRLAMEFDRKDAESTVKSIEAQCQALQYLVREFYFLSQIHPKMELCPKPERMEIRIVPAQGTEKAYISVGLIMEKMDGTLSDILAALNPTENAESLIKTLCSEFPNKTEAEILEHLDLFRKDLGHQLATLVLELHKLGYAHKDIKPANIGFRMDKMGGIQLVLLDFGSLGSGAVSADIVGSLHFMDQTSRHLYGAQLLQAQVSKGRATMLPLMPICEDVIKEERQKGSAPAEKADVYSTLVTIFEILGAVPPTIKMNTEKDFIQAVTDLLSAPLVPQYLETHPDPLIRGSASLLRHTRPSISSIETLVEAPFGRVLSEDSQHLHQLRSTPSRSNLILGRAIVNALMKPIPE